MGVITDAFVAALKKVKNDEGILTDAELAQLTTMVDIKAEEHVKTATADLQAKVDSNTADLKKINDALVDPTTTATETTAAIGEVLGVAPVNAVPVPDTVVSDDDTLAGGAATDAVSGASGS